MSPDERRQLAGQQAALVRALAGGSELPAGFDKSRVATTAASLLAKRRRGVEKTWPSLAQSLGDRFGSAFAVYADAHPLPAQGPFADGRQFARHLRRIGQLPDEGRLQLLLCDLGRRRPVGIAYLPGRRRLAIAFRTFRAACWFTLPLIGHRRPDFSRPLSPSTK